MKIGFVKDAFSGMPHVMASKNGEKIEVKSITEYGKSIVADFNFDVKNISNTIPVGFIFTGFVSQPHETDDLRIEKIVAKKDLRLSGSFKNDSSNKKPNATSVAISKFSVAIDKINAVEFKATAFKNSTKKSEFLRRINSKKVLFDERLRTIVKNPRFAFSEVEKDLIHSQFTDGFIRKAADKDMSKKPKNRRMSRRAEALENLSSESEMNPKSRIALRMQKARKDVKRGR
jgi:hypothetical protein